MIARLTQRFRPLRTCVAVGLCLLCVPAFAEGDIASCVDENGVITYTDVFCYTVNESPTDSGLGYVPKDPTLTKAPSIYEPFPLNETDSAEPIIDSKLTAVIDMAKSECTSRFSRFFRKKHPYAPDTPDAEFNQLIDRFEKDSKVSVSLASVIKYEVDSNFYQSTVECTVQNLQDSTQWVVGFIEK